MRVVSQVRRLGDLSEVNVWCRLETPSVNVEIPRTWQTQVCKVIELNVPSSNGDANTGQNASDVIVAYSRVGVLRLIVNLGDMWF